MFDSIDADLCRMIEGAAPEVCTEIEKIQTLRTLADKIVRSTYNEE